MGQIVVVDFAPARLNPYSTGIWSATVSLPDYKFGVNRLNPYSTGIWSAT